MVDPRSLIEQEIPHLQRYALFLTRDMAAADDLVQDTLVRALDRIHLWMPGTRMRSWLFTIQHNLFINGKRRGWRESTTDDGTVPSDVAAATQDDHLSLRDLEAALWRLPLDQRLVVFMVGLEGMGYDEAAETLAVPVGTVRSRLSRARSALREFMEMPETSQQSRGGK